MITRVVAAAILRDGRVFAARRGPGQRQAGQWELPGGKVEPGESDAEALARELHEELGIAVRVGGYIGTSQFDYAHGTIALVAYQCRLINGEPTLTEHDQAAWLSADALESLSWAPADIPLIEPLKALLRR